MIPLVCKNLGRWITLPTVDEYLELIARIEEIELKRLEEAEGK